MFRVDADREIEVLFCEQWAVCVGVHDASVHQRLDETLVELERSGVIFYSFRMPF